MQNDGVNNQAHTLVTAAKNNLKIYDILPEDSIISDHHQENKYD